ncbi:MAG: nitrilase-related carbon-nitrogen hydrolase, partial [Gemmatimonadales bacterium]
MTSPDHDPFLVAAVQAAPAFLDRDATIDKACSSIAEVGAAGAKLAVFPECFIPTYPLWVWFIPPAKTRALRQLYTELLDNAVTIPSDATERLCDAAREANVAVAIGMNER